MLTEQNYVTIQKIIAECAVEPQYSNHVHLEIVDKTELVKMLSNYFELDNPRFSRRMFQIGCDS